MRVVALAVVTACSTAPPHAPVVTESDCGAPAPTPAPKPVQITPVELARISVPELHLALDTFTVDTPAFTAWPTGGGVIGHGVRIGERDTLRWLVRAANDEKIENFLEDHRDWRVHTEKLRACGAPVDAYVAEHDDEDITCVMTATGNHPAWIPPRRAIAFALPTEPPSIASFEIEAAEIAAFQPTIDRIIASLDCAR